MQEARSTVDLWGTGFCAAFNTRRTARAITSLYDGMLQTSGIRSTQFAILVGIAKAGSAAMGQLAEMLLLDHSTLTRSLRRMQTQGLLSISSRSIRRQRFVKLLPKGERQLAHSMAHWRQIQRKFVNRIGGEKTWTALQRQLECLSSVAIDLQNANHKSLAAGPGRRAGRRG